MGASRTLLRKLDLDLIGRLEASGRPQPTKKKPRTKEPRAGETYRQNGSHKLASFSQWRASPDVFKNRSSIRSHTPMNRSQNWPRARNYAHAREIGPSAEVLR